ncbi:MAG: Uma2 family endonuclease, partial [Chloroflexota bacterium]|nr:Uma2 family endonuclease [Chloroflexota bacterium]
RYEVVNGVLYTLPSPNRWHQDAVLRFSHYLLLHIKREDMGRVFIAPFDVELTPDVVVQPDVMVILKENLDKVTKSRVIGAPDLVIEVSSPGTVGHDRRSKQDKYAQAGVSEYWIADPAAQTVEVLVLQGDEYQSCGVFSEQDTLPSKIVPGLAVHVQQFFE